MENENKLKILMVSTEYPPMQGGVGRYTYNLVKALRSFNTQVYVCSGNEGEGEYKGLYPYNIHNSNILLKAIQKIDP
ncbi:MAG TPA: hypothetical protein VFK40_03260, partial [Nitrososphaeraceae archaeon]|nr:hypothetical protein [Nitrososphaeraceae archaeon]